MVTNFETTALSDEKTQGDNHTASIIAKIEHPEQKNRYQRLKPDTIIVHSGGYQGAFGLGFGLRWLDQFSSLISYGYTPQAIGGKDINQLNLNSQFQFFDFKMLSIGICFISFDLGIIYGLGKNLFLQLPKKYPKRYYSPTALRYLLGLKSGIALTDILVLTFQYVYLDSELSALVAERNENFFQKNGSIGIGISINIR